MGSPKLLASDKKLLASDKKLLAYDRRPGESMGVLPQLHITLGGKTVVINMMVVDRPLDFNMQPRHDFFYAMNFVVSFTLSSHVFSS